MGLLDLVNDLPQVVTEWEHIGEFLGIEVTDEDIWSIARESETVPLFSNIYMDCLLSSIKNECINQYNLDHDVINSYVNCMDSHLYVDGEVILSRDDFFGYMCKRLLKDVCIDEDGDIDEEFKLGNATFELGTPITEVWHYVEEHFNITFGNYIGAR